MTKKGILSERQMKLMNPIPEKDINELPENVQDSLNKYNDAGWAEPVPGQSIGTHAGGKYNNSDNQLPSSDNDGNEIQYKEWDVKNHNGHSRDASRFITWTDGSVYYTDNHYESFVKILPS